jgi:hypothetical protein
MNIIWSIEKLEFLSTTKFVTMAYWRVSATEDKYTSSTHGSCCWQNGNPSIPYVDLTQQNVLDWCWANGVEKDAIEANLAANIAEQKLPHIESGVPW